MDETLDVINAVTAAVRHQATLLRDNTNGRDAARRQAAVTGTRQGMRDATRKEMTHVRFTEYSILLLIILQTAVGQSALQFHSRDLARCCSEHRLYGS